MSDSETVATYNRQAEEYADFTDYEGNDRNLLQFMKQIPAGGFVLDLGCGPARASAYMRDNGFRVDPVDASEEMVRLANEKLDIGARVAVFEDIKGDAIYDGVWANFSLLHAPIKNFPGHLARIAQALKPGGAFTIGMKLGSGEKRDRLGRFYAYYSEEDLTKYLEEAGFELLDKTTGEGEGLAGGVEPWIVLSTAKSSG